MLRATLCHSLWCASIATYSLVLNLRTMEGIDMEQQLLNNFSVELLDRVVVTAYDPSSPHRAAANKALMALQEQPDVWTKADAILEQSQNPQTKFFGLQVLDACIRTRYVMKERNETRKNR